MQDTTSNIWGVRRQMRLILRSVRYNAHREVIIPTLVLVVRNQLAKRRRLGLPMREVQGWGLVRYDKKRRQWLLSAKGREYLFH